MEKNEIVRALEEIADLMEMRGDNPFRVRSFRNGARAIESLSEDLRARVEEGTLGEIKGIGKTLTEVIGELFETGTSETLEELRETVPPGLVEMNTVPGLGPKKALAIHKELGIETIEELEQACRDGKIAELSGFGKKSQEKILEGIDYRRKVGGRFLIVEVLAVAEPLLEHLRADEDIERVEIGGSLRRHRETVKDVDYIAVLRDGAEPENVMDRFVAWEAVEDVLVQGETKSSVRLEGGIQADLRVVDAVNFPYTLQYFTGSKEHNTVLRGMARDKGLKLNEYGLFKVDTDELVECEDEEAVYAALGLDWVPPELRENMGEVELAMEGKLPELVTTEDIRGIVHVHTTYSDGHESVREMADAARELGYEYLGISDHSQSAGYANGLKEDAIKRQHEEIDRVNEELGEELGEELDGAFRIFKGIESDIRMDGSLDYPEEILASFDFVIASIHSGFQLPADEQTDRIIRAMENPHTTFLAHPTGRLLLSRDGYAVDMERVLEAAGRLGVVVEINAHPRRLDLDWRWGKYARAHGVKTAIHPDAHHSDGYGDVVYGVGIARKAGFEAKDVVSALGVGAFGEFIGRRDS